jgi:hypothetical protein
MLAIETDDVDSLPGELSAIPFSIKTHNGFITMLSLKTGDHRTLRIWTQSKRSKFKPGERLIGLLVGSDNESDYRSFGTVTRDGRVQLYFRHAGDKFFKFCRDAVERPEAYAGKIEFSFGARCRKCNRLLTDPVSQELGIGPVCRGEE